MNLKTPIFSAIAVLASLCGNLHAQGIVQTVQEGCAAEISAYCSQVSPGEGRLLACFYAHEDKLSGQCQYALYSASAQLDAAVSALDYVATQCRDDILKLCAEVQVGEGRVLECLKSNSATVSAACNQAVSDVTQ
jgi:hypothetical protein